MNNFLEFIEKDIEAKKTLISTLPTKTKANKKKYNDNIDVITKKYIEYKKALKNYLLAKSRSLSIKENEVDLEKLNNNIAVLEHAKFLLNPTNTYFEKMGFDNLLYQMTNYYNFNFSCLNDIINGFLDKFELASITLSSNDFDYTFYVHEYMTSFLEVSKSKTKSYGKVSEIFEQIYWINPEIIEHIELNFRKLIRKNEKKFDYYISRLQKETMKENNIRNYEDCLEKLKNAYIELNIASEEDVWDILSSAKNGDFDISQYLKESKVRDVAFNSLTGEGIDINSKIGMDKFCESLEKLKGNIEEYSSYLEFTILFDNFKKEYDNLISDGNKNKNTKGLNDFLVRINKGEKSLEKINNKITKKGRPFNQLSEKNMTALKISSVQMAKELSSIYHEYEKECFKNKVLELINKNLSVSDVLNLYYSFDYFKKFALQKAYDITNYDEIIKYSDSFDLFAMDPTNVIIQGIFLFDENNVAKNIANKYRLNGITLTDSDLDEDNLKTLLNKIYLILRVNKIENSSTTVENIWFIVQVEKIIEKEATKKIKVEK